MSTESKPVSAGDLVKLRSGSPVMVVQEVFSAKDEGREPIDIASCTWFPMTTMHFAPNPSVANFAVAALEVFPP